MNIAIDDERRDDQARDDRSAMMVTTATITRGTPKRTACWSLLTSFVVRATRSPVPARSTMDSGRAVTFSMNSSRSSANTSSPNTIDARCANRMSTVCASTATTPTAIERVDVARRGAAGDGVDEQAEQPRTGQAGGRGERVQDRDEDQRAAVLAA